MTKARKQANFRRKLAVLFFIFFIANIALKLAGITTLSAQSGQANALGMQITYYAIPAFFLLVGILFAYSSKSKSAEAESIEIGGCSW
jgi:TRAP-type C4-dicarboxylate transport system permease small subunit